MSGREGVFVDPPQGRRAVGHNGGEGVVLWKEISGCPNASANRISYLTFRYNVVEHNEIHHCMECLGVRNGVYISGTRVGNVIRRNWVHDIAGQEREMGSCLF